MPQRRARDLLQRDDAAAGDLPRRLRHARARRCLGVVPPDAGRHLARPADGPGARSARSASRRSGSWCCWRCARSCSAPRRARWWCRVADVSSRAPHRPRVAAASTPGSRGCGCGPRWPIPTSFWILTVSSGPDHAARLRRAGADVPHLTELGGFTLREVALLYGASGIGIGVGRPGDRQRRADRHPRPHRPARPDADPAGAAAGAGLRRPVRAAPPRPDQPGRGRLRLGALAVDWTPPRVALAAVMMVVGVALIFFGLFVALLVRPVLDHRLHRVRQRLHLRRQHHHPVPDDHLPARGRSRG